MESGRLKIRNKITTSVAQGSLSANKQQTQVKKRSRTNFKLKPSVIAVYVSTFVLIVSMVFIGSSEPKNSSVTASALDVNSSNKVNQTSVDNVVATGVAASIAQAANLPIATSVANLAVSAQTKSDFTQADGMAISKPQLIESEGDNRSVTSHTVVAGDTVESLSIRYGISKETIKWANNLTSDTPSVGSVLRILPVDGVIYSVKSGDTVDSISTKYGVDKTRLVLYNDLDVSGLSPNTSIILPNATLPGNERPGYVAPVSATNFYYAGSGAGFGGRTWRIGVGTPDGPYAHGNCTLYAYNRRIQLGLPVGRNWGNASSWAANARTAGIRVDNFPSVGAIIQNGGYLGHVGIVESILPNGDVSISEMNAYVSGGGYNIVSGRIISAGNAGQYLYIH